MRRLRLVDPDVLRRKTAQVLHHCDRLQRRATLSAADLERDEDLANIVLMDLQQAVQACLDLAVHVCADDNLGAPATYAEAFSLLSRAGRITPELARRLAGAAGLRNIIVHQYAELDFARVASAAHENLDDLRRFVAVVRGEPGE